MIFQLTAGGILHYIIEKSHEPPLNNGERIFRRGVETRQLLENLGARQHRFVADARPSAAAAEAACDGREPSIGR